MPILKANSLAYFDSFSGLIPCKVICINGPSGRASSEQKVMVRLTANRRGYKKGEVLTEWALHVVPRDAVYFRDHSARIGSYLVEGDQEYNEGVADTERIRQ